MGSLYNTASMGRPLTMVGSSGRRISGGNDKPPSECSSDCELFREKEFESVEANVFARPRKNGGSMAEEPDADDEGDIGVPGGKAPDEGDGGNVEIEGDAMGVSLGERDTVTAWLIGLESLLSVDGIGDKVSSGGGMSSPRTAATI
jgi:hypothetical protein